ncbi:PRECURSOR OF CEP5 [Salix viminalis]|uniref:PRECURSOR OF CEP5 n=1 Tax=Salix viminalis TaxID=40686 RepID=A0A9Q0UV80_SALVM|nr:PRECURSOR OF CEP5 [Salix viminalis]
MEKIKLLCAFVFLVLFFSEELQFIEGRHLKTRISSKFLQKEMRKLAENNSKFHVNENSDKSVDTAQTSPSAPPTPAVSEPHPSPPGHVDDFRPTAPGHSPGVGHSLQN